MIIPKKVDGTYIGVVTTPDGSVYVDMPRVARSEEERVRHFHRFEEYGLVDQEGTELHRCRKCGLVERKYKDG